MTNRADRRRQARCKHDWKTKEFGDGIGHRWCELCDLEEWHDSETRFGVARDASASGGVR